MRTVIIAVLLTGCGPVFTLNDASSAEKVETTTASLDASSDAGDSETSSKAADASSDAESSETSSPVHCSAPYTCGSTSTDPPYTYCTAYKHSGAMGVAMAVAPCNTCETFTCACLLSIVGCRGASCAEHNGQVFVSCDL